MFLCLLGLAQRLVLAVCVTDTPTMCAFSHSYNNIERSELIKQKYIIKMMFAATVEMNIYQLLM